MMPYTIYIRRLTGYDVYGKPVYGAAEDFRAAIQGTGGRPIRDAKTGNERVSTYAVYVATTAMIAPEDKLVLPSQFVPNSPPIIRVDPQSNENGIHHMVVYS